MDAPLFVQRAADRCLPCRRGHTARVLGYQGRRQGRWIHGCIHGPSPTDHTPLHIAATAAEAATAEGGAACRVHQGGYLHWGRGGWQGWVRRYTTTTTATIREEVGGYGGPGPGTRG